MRDTSEPALERYYELLRARSPLARLTTAVDLSAAVRQLAESSIRAAAPGASTGVVRARLALRLYRRQVAARLFPGVKLINALRHALGTDFEVDATAGLAPCAP